MSLRDKQIREILDEDLRDYNEVLKREFKQVRLMNESYAPPNRLERKVAFDIDKYFIQLNTALDTLVSAYSESGTIDSGDIQQLTSLYDTLISYLDKYSDKNQLNQRDLAALEDKFDTLTPKVEQLAIAADELRNPQAQLLNAFYNLLESRDYVPLRGNTSEVLGRRRMLVDRQEDAENPHFNPGSYTPQTSVDNRPYENIRKDEAVEYHLASAEANALPDREIADKEAQKAVLEDTLERLDTEVTDAYNASQRDPEDEFLKRVLEAKFSSIRSATQEYDRLQQEIQRLYVLKSLGDRGIQRRSWSPPERRGRERLTKDKLKNYFDVMSADELKDAVDNIPHIKQGVESQKNKKSLLAKIKSNEAYMRDIYSMREEGIYPTENLPTPRGRQASVSMTYYSPSVEREEEIFPDYPPIDLDVSTDAEGDGRTSFVKSKKGRFQMRGKGESEDKMFGLPVGFKKAMTLRPMDRKPIIHHNTQDFDTTLEERMQFLNQLDSHKISEEEWKLNSIRNLSEMKEKKYKKKPLR